MRLTVSGHAAPKGAVGYEVCIAASTLTQGLAKAVRGSAPGAVVEYRKAKGDMTLVIRPADGVRTECDTLIRGFLAALRDLAGENAAYMTYSETEE